MKTRIELWKDYRKEINNNMGLQKSVQSSNEQLSVLYKRLIEAYPKYKFKYKIESNKRNTNNIEIESAPKYSNKKIIDIIKELNDLDDDAFSFSSIDKIDFSSHELDDVMADIKRKKVTAKKIFIVDENENTSEIQLNNIKQVQLKEEGVIKMIKKLNIAIDGPSGSGKSTLAKALAVKYKLKYINTGLVYRTIALNAEEESVNFNNPKEIINSLKTLQLKLLDNEEVIMNDVDVTKELRADNISRKSAIVSSIQEVRQIALKIQKSYAKQEGTIMDGRDTTFKIMPDADVKIFLDSKASTRAQRRVDQNKKLGFNINYEKVLSEIEERDARDKGRAIDPLHKTEDAILIDSTNLNLNQVIEKVSKIIDAKMN